MVRLIAALLVGLQLPIPAGGSVVVVVPFAGGTVVAADSRTTILGATCDNRFKITQVKRPARTIVAVTGAIAFIPQPAYGQTPSCILLESAPRLLDIAAVVESYLEHQPDDIARVSLEGVSAACVAAVQDFQKSRPEALDAYAGKELFSVVMAAYDPRSRISTILNFVVNISAGTRAVRADRLTRFTILARDRRGVWSFGETDYLTKNVFAGLGRKYLCKPTRDFILESKPVSAAPQNEAVAAAINIIAAATRTADELPAPSAIGGPIHVILLGRPRRPREIPLPSDGSCHQPPQSVIR